MNSLTYILARQQRTSPPLMVRFVYKWWKSSFSFQETDDWGLTEGTEPMMDFITYFLHLISRNLNLSHFLHGYNIWGYLGCILSWMRADVLQNLSSRDSCWSFVLFLDSLVWALCENFALSRVWRIQNTILWGWWHGLNQCVVVWVDVDKVHITTGQVDAIQRGICRGRRCK